MSTAKEPEKPDDLTDAQVRMIREMFSAKIKRPMSQCNLKYDGSQDFYTTEKFISSVTEYKALERITDEEALADISVLLEKEAAAWWGSVKAQIKTWKEFTDQFRQRFSDKPSYVVYQDIVNDKQGDDEPFDDFVQRKRMLFARLSPPGYNEKQQIDLIYGQMHPKLREKVPRSLLEDNYYLFTHVRKAEEQIKKEKEASLNIHNDTPQNTAEKQQRTRCGSSLSVGHVEESCAKAEISSQAIISVKLSQSLSEPISKVTLSNMVQDRQELEPPRRVTRSLKKKHSDVMQNMSTEQITVEPQKKQSKLSKSGKQGNSKVQVKSTRVTQSQNKPTEMSNVENLKEPTKTADKEDKVGVDKQIKHEDKVDSTAVPSTSWKLTPMPPFMPKMSCIGCGGKEQVGYYREVCPQCCSDEEKTKLDETFSPVIVIDIFDHLQEEVANIDDCEGCSVLCTYEYKQLVKNGHDEFYPEYHSFYEDTVTIKSEDGTEEKIRVLRKRCRIECSRHSNFIMFPDKEYSRTIVGMDFICDTEMMINYPKQTYVHADTPKHWQPFNTFCLMDDKDL